MENIVGTILKNRYRVDDFLGRGGMAEVYKVWDIRRTALLAMKLLNADLAEDTVFIRRFKREGKTLEDLKHPNIVRFYGLEEDGERVFMLMDYVDGVTLRKEIKAAGGQPISAERITAVMRPVCSALNYAHQMGVVHCDIKPANIMIHKNGTVFVTDFGIARQAEGVSSTTLVGAGTPAYMAPEQVGEKVPTPQMDIYALGVILFEMCTGGERPFTGERATISGSTSEKVRWEKTHLDPSSLLDLAPSVPKMIEDVIRKCLAKSPKKRYAGVPEFLAALEEALGTSGMEIQNQPLEGVATANEPSQVRNEPVKEVEARPGDGWRRLNPIWKGVLILAAAVILIMIFSSLGNSSKGENLVSQLGANQEGMSMAADNVESSPTPTAKTAAIPTSIPVPTSRPEPTSTPKAEPTDESWEACPGTYDSRLHSGDRAYVSFDPPLSNRVRSKPSRKSSVVGSIEPGEKVKIKSGPTCADDWVWWKITSEDSGLEGWTSEGDYEGYWLVPLP